VATGSLLNFLAIAWFKASAFFDGYASPVTNCLEFFRSGKVSMSLGRGMRPLFRLVFSNALVQEESKKIGEYQHGNAGRFPCRIGLCRKLARVDRVVIQHKFGD
jgi:hypothetical protein